MINQHLEMAIAELQEFIDSRPDAREARKPLAVKLVYQGYKYLGNSDNFGCVTWFHVIFVHQGKAKGPPNFLISAKNPP